MSIKTKLVPVSRNVALLPERDANASPILECIDLGVTFGGLKAVVTASRLMSLRSQQWCFSKALSSISPCLRATLLPLRHGLATS